MYELNLILGYTGTGKTLFSLYNAAYKLYIEQKKVNYVSFEIMDIEYMVQKFNGLYHYFKHTEPTDRSFTNFMEWFKRDGNFYRDFEEAPRDGLEINFILIPTLSSLSSKEGQDFIKDYILKAIDGKQDAVYFDCLGMYVNPISDTLDFFKDLANSVEADEAYFTSQTNRVERNTIPSPLDDFKQFFIFRDEDKHNVIEVEANHD